MNIVNCRPAYTYIKITKPHNFTLKTKKGADDYASGAEPNLHKPTGGIGDGHTDILYMLIDNLTT